MSQFQVVCLIDRMRLRSNDQEYAIARERREKCLEQKARELQRRLAKRK